MKYPTEEDWRCRKCGTLLGNHRGESVHVKHKRGQLVVRGHVMAVCPRCAELAPSACTHAKRSLLFTGVGATLPAGGLWRPLTEDPPRALTGLHLEGHEAAWVVALVEADARHARDLGVDPRVVMPEEAHARPKLGSRMAGRSWGP